MRALLVALTKELKELIKDNMPLIQSSSDKARNENIKKEIKLGYPPKQAAAIGYSNQRKNKSKGK